MSTGCGGPVETPIRALGEAWRCDREDAAGARRAHDPASRLIRSRRQGHADAVQARPWRSKGRHAVDRSLRSIRESPWRWREAQGCRPRRGPRPKDAVARSCLRRDARSRMPSRPRSLQRSHFFAAGSIALMQVLDSAPGGHGVVRDARAVEGSCSSGRPSSITTSRVKGSNDERAFHGFDEVGSHLPSLRCGDRG
jgi:hypothetical protein